MTDHFDPGRMARLLAEVPLGRYQPLGIALNDIGAVKGMDRNPPTSRNKAPDLIPRKRMTTACEIDQDIRDAFNQYTTCGALCCLFRASNLLPLLLIGLLFKTLAGQEFADQGPWGNLSITHLGDQFVHRK